MLNSLPARRKGGGAARNAAEGPVPRLAGPPVRRPTFRPREQEPGSQADGAGSRTSAAADAAAAAAVEARAAELRSRAGEGDQRAAGEGAACDASGATAAAQDSAAELDQHGGNGATSAADASSGFPFTLIGALNSVLYQRQGYRRMVRHGTPQ